MSESSYWRKTAKLDEGKQGTSFANNGSLTENDNVAYVGLLVVSNDSKGETISGISAQIQDILFGLSGLQFVLKIEKVVSYDSNEIKETLFTWTTNFGLSLIITSGGTGIEATDVVPEVTKDVVDKDLPGISAFITTKCLSNNSTGVLFRGICGVKKEVLIINLPSSPGLLKSCLESVSPYLVTCVDLIKESRNSENGDETSYNSFVRPTNGIISSTPLQKTQKEKLRIVGQPPSINRTNSQQPGEAGDNLKLARRNRVSPYPPVDVDQAFSIMLLNIFPLPFTSKYFQDAYEHYLFEDVNAKESVPSCPTVILDGYAVIASDTPGDLEILGANAENSYLTLGKAIRVRTGSVLPPGSNAVVPVEETMGESELVVRMLEAKTPGSHIRAIGSDLMKGEVILKAGTKLGHVETGLLAVAGVLTVSVHRLPTVAVMSIGNELTEPNKVELSPGEARDTNRITLLLALHKAGFPTLDAGLVCNKPDVVRESIKTAYKNADAVIITGCASIGENDTIKSLLQDMGAKIHYGRVSVKPGAPTSFSTIETQRGKKVIFSLPGNPVPAIVAYYILVLPCLRRMAGSESPKLPVIQVKVSAEIFLGKLQEYQRATIRWEGDGMVPWADVTGRQIISRLMSMVEADVLLQLPPRSDSVKSIPKGRIVNAVVIK
uniref:gephyrin isoform X2 n=1 Tax=Ciona intestinalis TaxID=7719 RepID=UPI0005217E25|nr:gephyrin isoform X2 [Ciona intestinalis]|eukprot:XP_009862289.1 gephyrin isoform X2 [Ciona intestinalis]